MHFLALGASLLAFGIGQVAAAHPKGIDVSGWQTKVNWTSVKAHGISFAYIKATEGLTYKSPEFSHQYNGAYNKSIIRGSYHFAQPHKSSGAAQAKYFLAHGGGWSADGKTLPGTIDLEYNPNGAACYGVSKAGMVAWIKSFSNYYHSKTKRYPVIYTSTSWWNMCTGSSKAFGKTNPLWVARYASKVGTLPAGWAYETFWQHSDNADPNPGDADIFNGDAAGLKRFAKGS